MKFKKGQYVVFQADYYHRRQGRGAVVMGVALGTSFVNSDVNKHHTMNKRKPDNVFGVFDDKNEAWSCLQRCSDVWEEWNAGLESLDESVRNMVKMQTENTLKAAQIGKST